MYSANSTRLMTTSKYRFVHKCAARRFGRSDKYASSTRYLRLCSVLMQHNDDVEQQMRLWDVLMRHWCGICSASVLSVVSSRLLWSGTVTVPTKLVAGAVFQSPFTRSQNLNLIVNKENICDRTLDKMAEILITGLLTIINLHSR